MRPIGVPDTEWSVGYGKTYTVDGLPLVASWGGGSYTARAVARVGRLMLHEGDWDGKRLLSKEAVRQITADAGTPGHGGIGWWSNNSGKYAKLPKDAFWGSGAGHQVVLVVPSLNLIAVRNGENLSTTEEHHDALNAYLFEPLDGRRRRRRRQSKKPRAVSAERSHRADRLGAEGNHRSTGEGERQLAADLGRRRPPLHGLRRRQRLRAARSARS